MLCGISKLFFVIKESQVKINGEGEGGKKEPVAEADRKHRTRSRASSLHLIS